MENTLTRILSHQLIQVLSFSVILVGSPYFGGPYLFFVLGSFLEGYVFGILGVVGVLMTLISLKFFLQKYLQIGGLLFMIASLAVFFLSSPIGRMRQLCAKFYH